MMTGVDGDDINGSKEGSSKDDVDGHDNIFSHFIEI